MSWKDQLQKDPLSWLLESSDPGVAYLALRDLFDLSPEDRKLRSARKAAHRGGSIAAVLSKVNQDGHWVNLGYGRDK
jgi:hypothetical protein